MSGTLCEMSYADGLDGTEAIPGHDGGYFREETVIPRGCHPLVLEEQVC
ncbi:hypothetical protein P3T23_008438 [Paraburkholderia sp. GAS448]